MIMIRGKGGNNMTQDISKVLENSQKIKSLSFIFGWYASLRILANR